MSKNAPTISVTDRQGGCTPVAAQVGRSVMEAIRAAGMDQLLALCGGECSCGTCHVYVAPEWRGIVGGPGEDELMLLEASAHFQPDASRLSCQIAVTDAHDGLAVTIAPED